MDGGGNSFILVFSENMTKTALQEEVGLGFDLKL